ncbi:hypothetical protein JVU11DRAFT_6946 [Chiua virens]|nr:hypothetical protein JVU11DRAFT_6946 [Chiua virens]
MFPTSRYVGGAARPRDLRVVAKATTGHFEKYKHDQSRSLDNATLPVSESVDSLEGHHLGNVPLRTVPVSQVDTSFAPQSSFTSQQARTFHTSTSAPYESTSYNATDGVPDFFIRYKQHRATSLTSADALGRTVDELGLMPSLTKSTLSGDVVATTRRLKAKIPVEHQAGQGHVIHPSGFVVPGPGHTSTSDVARAKERERNDRQDRLVQTAAVARRVLESDFEQVDATTLPAAHKVPFEVREPDGTVKHPSGFVPPTPAHKFRYAVGTSALWDRKVSGARQKARQPSPARGVLRAVHTTASATKDSGDAL